MVMKIVNKMRILSVFFLVFAFAFLSFVSAEVGDNSQGEFELGTLNNVFYNDSFLQLNTSGGTSGNFTSRVLDVNATVRFDNFSWLSNFLGELPDNQLDYTFTGINMTGNVLLLHLNEGSGVIQDSSGIGNNGVYNGAMYSREGKLNSAIGFDGVNDYIDIGNAGQVIIIH